MALGFELAKEALELEAKRQLEVERAQRLLKLEAFFGWAKAFAFVVALAVAVAWCNDRQMHPGSAFITGAMGLMLVAFFNRCQNVAAKQHWNVVQENRPLTGELSELDSQVMLWLSERGAYETAPTRAYRVGAVWFCPCCGEPLVAPDRCATIDCRYEERCSF